MLEVRQTRIFQRWLENLADRQASRRIAARILRLEGGNFGDAKSVGRGVTELRIDHGPGYRVYLAKQGLTVIILLCGGDKGSQSRDIETAQALAAEL